MSARTLPVDSSGTTRSPKRWALIDSGGVTRFGKRVFIIDAGGVARLVFNPQIIGTVLGGPAQASGFGPATLTTNSVTASVVSGGTGPFTFAWTFQSGGAGLTPTNPAGASTAWTGHIIPGASLIGVALCTITDSVGTVGTVTVNVNISATN